MRRNIQDMEKCAFDAFKRRTVLRDMIGVTLVPSDSKDESSPDVTFKALNKQLWAVQSGVWSQQMKDKNLGLLSESEIIVHSS